MTDPQIIPIGRLVSDPTALTTEALRREIALLEEKISLRLEAIDTATRLRHDHAGVVSAGIDKQISDLVRARDDKFACAAELTREQFSGVEKRFTETFKTVNEQFRGVQTQFAERDVRVAESAKTIATAVEAGLRTQKDAAEAQNKSFTTSIDKSEKTTGEQITQQRVSFEGTTNSLKGTIDDVKERLTRLESLGIGRAEQSATSHTGNQWALSLVVAGFSLVGLVLVLIRDLAK